MRPEVKSYPEGVIIHPQAITSQSFLIIQQELAAGGIQLPPDVAPIVERLIHSTADFDFAEITRIAPDAIESGINAIRQGCAIVTDVNMVRMGISAQRVQQLGGSLHCFVAEDETRQRAVDTGNTRSALGIRLAWERNLLDGSIVVIGNAPTALFELLHLIEAQRVRPALIVGVPVGFVNVVESKEQLMQTDTVPWIVTAGRKGGSSVAVAVVNALLRMAEGVAPTATD